MDDKQKLNAVIVVAIITFILQLAILVSSRLEYYELKDKYEKIQWVK